MDDVTRPRPGSAIPVNLESGLADRNGRGDVPTRFTGSRGAVGAKGWPGKPGGVKVVGVKLEEGTQTHVSISAGGEGGVGGIRDHSLYKGENGANGELLLIPVPLLTVGLEQL